MATHNFDFAAEPIADPATPPSGLVNYFNNGKIIDPGFKSSNNNANVGSAWARTNDYSGNIVKVEATLAVNDAYTGGSSTQISGVAILNVDNSASILGTVKASTGNVINSKVAAADGNSITGSFTATRVTTSPLYSANEFGADAKITAYHDRVAGYIYYFLNDTVFPVRVATATGTGTAFKYGVHSAATTGGGTNQANTIKALNITDSVSSIPLHIAFDVGGVAQASDTMLSGWVNSGFVYAGRYLDAPLESVFTRNGKLNFKVPNITNYVDCILPYDPGISGIFYRNHFKFWNQNELATIKHAAPYPRFIQSGGVNTSMNPTANWTATSALSAAYNAVTGRHITTTTTIFHSTTIGLTINASTGVITSSTNTTAQFYIWDTVDMRVRQFTATFSGGNVSGVTRTQNRLLTVWEAAIDTWVESEEYTPSLGGGSFSVYSANAEISVFSGGSWSAWGRYTGTGQKTMVNGEKLKLRMKTAKVSDTPRTIAFTITNGGGFTQTWNWTTRTLVDVAAYNPSRSLTPEQQLIGLINFENGASLTDAKVDISNPVAYNDYESGNTKATVTGLPNSGVTGSLDIIYQRMELTRFNNINNRILVEVSASASWTQVINALKSQYGIALTTDDYNDEPGYSPVVSGTANKNITIKTGSLLYVPGTYVLEVTVV